MKYFPKAFLLLAVIVLSVSSVKAQVMIGGIQEYLDYSNINSSDGINNPYSEFKGSPFMVEDFQEGQIKLNDGKIYEGKLRYDVYADQIEFIISDGKIYAVKNLETVKAVTIGSSGFLSLSKEAGNSLDGIYEVLVEGDYLLIEKHLVELKDAKPAQPYIEAKPATFFTKKSKYLILNMDGEFVEIKDKKDLLTMKTKKSDELENYVKKHKVKTSQKKDLIDFTNFLNK